MTETLSFKMNPDHLSRAAVAIKEYLRSETGEEHSTAAVESALEHWIDRKVDLVLESVHELLTTPGSDESLEFAQLLQQAEGSSIETAVPRAESELAEHPMFNGNRVFSPARLAAMMGYLSSKGLELYKTKLNKLLFYSDMTAYYLTGQGISGARYVHLPYGPVPDTYENVISLAEISGNISVKSLPASGTGVRLIEPGQNAAESVTELDDTDRKVLDWVAANYGKLSTSEITELSHQEMAYKNTNMGEAIAYRYSEFLQTVPPRDLLTASNQDSPA